MPKVERDRGVLIIDLMGDENTEENSNIISVASSVSQKEVEKIETEFIMPPPPLLQIVQIEITKEPPKCRNQQKKKNISH